MIKFKWNITGLTIQRDAVDGARDLVMDASWELTGEDETSGIMAMRYGTEPLADPARHAVTKEMTQELVVEWVQATFAPAVIPMLKDSLVARIEKQVNDTRYQVTAPWRVKDEPVAGGPDVVSEDPLRPDVI
jgi:hypothetical protein